MPYEACLSDQSMPQVMWQTEEQTNELQSISSIINDYVKECSAKFIIGDMDLENDWESYLEELDTMGLTKYVDIYQDIVDAQS